MHSENPEVTKLFAILEKTVVNVGGQRQTEVDPIASPKNLSQRMREKLIKPASTEDRGLPAKT